MSIYIYVNNIKLFKFRKVINNSWLGNYLSDHYTIGIKNKLWVL